MNQFLKLFQNKVFLIVVIVILIGVIIYLLTDNFRDAFNNLSDFSRVPPHIENLYHQQMMPQVPAVADQTPDTNINHNNSINAPNYGRTNQENNPTNTSMVSGNIYRMKTGRDAYQQEQFVSIYDSNFGGMLGTTMGLY
jgi:rare lipoprotein A (peptidoglycan hydrolase)